MLLNIFRCFKNLFNYFGMQDFTGMKRNDDPFSFFMYILWLPLLLINSKPALNKKVSASCGVSRGSLGNLHL